VASRNGMERADVDVALMADPKVVALARKLRDESRTMNAVGLYVSTVLASWQAGERLTLDEAVPAWWMGEWDALALALVEARLLDGERRVPEHVWEGWYEPAAARRAKFRDLGARGGRKSAEGRSGAGPDAPAGGGPGGGAGGDRTPNRTVKPNQPTIQPTNHPGSARGARADVLDALRGEEPDPVDTWYGIFGSPPSPRVLPWLNDLADTYGDPAVCAALQEAQRRGADRTTMMGQTQAVLQSSERKDRRAAVEERESAPIREARELEARHADMTPEQREANMARLRDMLTTSGVLPAGES